MNRIFLCILFITVISLELLVPCANAGPGEKFKKVGKAMKQGGMETAKGIRNTSVKFGKSVVTTAGHGIVTGVHAVGTGLACGLCPVWTVVGLPDEGMDMAGRAARHLLGSAVKTGEHGIDAGKHAAVLGKKVATSPCVCGTNTMQAMAEMERQEEILAEIEEEKRRKFKKLPESSN
ncbi:uncharacterized protein LOC116347465 [Contarinia nasturtii]|uniref:uncharacterized protein LOC116347465 n=1 Tax=Contarinia nasturtii TaxID=265458 RepID=UPI0012D387AD|nr:uncharacterized protein LOC116347465 [Contarinia nasturtii]